MMAAAMKIVASNVGLPANPPRRNISNLRHVLMLARLAFNGQLHSRRQCSRLGMNSNLRKMKFRSDPP